MPSCLPNSYLYLAGRLQARQLVVGGDLYLAPGSILDCPQVAVYGQLLGATPPEAAVMADTPEVTTVLVVERMEQ